MHASDRYLRNGSLEDLRLEELGWKAMPKDFAMEKLEQA